MNYQFTTNVGEKYLVQAKEDGGFQNPLVYAYEDGIQAIIDTKFCREDFCDKADSFESLERNFEKIFGVKKGKKTTVLAASEAGYTILPIWGYSHGGYDFCASYENPYDKWDSGLAGYIWCKKSTFDKDDGEMLQKAIHQYTNYFNNEVWMLDFISLKDGEEFIGVGSIYDDLNEETIKCNCVDVLGEGKLEPYFGTVKQQLSMEDFNDKIESILNDYWLTEIPKEKIEALRAILK